MNTDYFRHETALLSEACLQGVKTLEDWTSYRTAYQSQLQEMLGLFPWPERSDLAPVITRRTEMPDFSVENLYFQSMPGLYVTGNLYRPRDLTGGPVPAILYACGHSQPNRIDGITYGAKIYYQHHGAWLARNGYVCLVVDTLQLGEIEGLHHGIYREGRWHWYSRGYTPAGVEAWNGIRALDYLQTRPEVDGERLGVTGRSGGGAASWWIATVDERIKAAVPVAGITDLKDQVVHDCLELHCDCMFPINTYRWDFAQLAAMVAPRALLIGNTDRDPLFPLDGVVRLHEKVRRIYRLYGQPERLGLLITEGPHHDTQELQLAALRWFDRHLKEVDRPIENAAVDFFTRQELKVLPETPAGERNTTIDESFVPTAPIPPVPETLDAWKEQRDAWRRDLKEKVFGGWPEDAEYAPFLTVFSSEWEGISLRAVDFLSQPGIRLRLYLAAPPDSERVTLHVMDEADGLEWRKEWGSLFSESGGEGATATDDAILSELRERLADPPQALAWLSPRGIGPDAGELSDYQRTQLRRRYMLLGQTLDGMRVWDVRRALQTLREIPETAGAPIHLEGEWDMAPIALYAAVFGPDVVAVRLVDPPITHRDGPDFLNVLRVLDVPQAAALASATAEVEIVTSEPDAWAFPREVARRLGEEAARFRWMDA